MPWACSASFISLGLSVALVSHPSLATAATCSPAALSNCSAAGGSGVPNRSGNGGSGNGGGGGSSELGAGGVTVQIPGAESGSGAGGAGAQNDSAQQGSGGAAGAVIFGDVAINVNIAGSAGAGSDGFNFASGGGGGGAGVYSTGSNVSVNSGVNVSGGAGGNGGAGTSGPASNGGGGGGGGAGMILVTPVADFTNQGSVVGGNGGTGGGGGNPGGGGGGGDGVLTLGSGAQVTNIGTITGGIGGAGGGGISTAGASGAGVHLGAGFNVLTNVGVITGGAGNGAAAGAGVITNGAVIINDGTISGGLYSDGVTRAAAIQFNGTNNTLQLMTGSTLIGTLEITSGAAAKIVAVGNGVALNNDVSLGSATSGLVLDSFSKALTVSGAISGAGTVQVQGNLGITLAGNNTYTGGTTNTGLLQVGNGGTSGAIAGNIVNNGTLIFNRSDTVTYAGDISGTGNLVQAGTGTLILSGAISHGGSTAINAGTLAVAGSGRLSAGSAVTLSGASAALDLSAAADQSVTHLSGVAGSRLILGVNALTLSDNSSQSFDGALSGNGALVKQGSGTLTLNGASTGYHGTVTVAGGTLMVGNAANPGAVLGGSVQVGALGALGGHGSISGNVVNGGLVTPGGSIGTLTVGGNYTQSAGATLAIEVSPTQSSLLQAGGSATLAGTLALSFDPGTYSARSYTLLTAAGGINGRFGNVTTTTAGAVLGRLQPVINYQTGTVELVLADPAVPGTPGIPLGSTGSARDSLVIAPTQTSIYTALGTTAMLQAHSTGAALLARLASPPAALAGSHDVWIQASGTSTKVGRQDNAPGYSSQSYGFLAGSQAGRGAATLGAAAGYTHTSLGEEGTSSSGAIDSVRVALYGAVPAGPVHLSGTLGYGSHFLSQKRAFGALGSAEGNHLGHEFSVSMQASLPVQMDTFELAPSAGLRYVYVRGSAFGESGAGGQNLQVGPDNVRSLQPNAGIALRGRFGENALPSSFQLRVGYAYEALAAGRAVRVISQDGTLFSAPGNRLPRSFMTADAALLLWTGKTTTVSLGVGALINTSHVASQSASLWLNHQF